MGKLVSLTLPNYNVPACSLRYYYYIILHYTAPAIYVGITPCTRVTVFFMFSPYMSERRIHAVASLRAYSQKQVQTRPKGSPLV